MSRRSFGFPKQRLSYEEKTRNDYEWVKQVVGSIFKYADTNMPGRFGTEEYKRALRNYRWYNNQIDQKEFENECNIFGLDIDQIKEDVLPFSKAPNKINTLLGEEITRPFSYRTVLINPEGVRMKMRLKDDMITKYFEAQLQDMMRTLQGLNPETDPKELMTPEQIEEYFRTKYRDIREHYADNILKYLYKEDRLKDKKNDSFAHGLKSGYEIVKVGIKNGFPTVEVINPLNAFWHKSPETRYIQNALFAGHTKFMTLGEVIDEYGDELTDEQMEQLEGMQHGGQLDDKMRIPKGGALNSVLQSVNFNYEGSYGTDTSLYDISVRHVEWVSQKKIGFLEYIDDAGDLVTTMVNEDFNVPDYAEKRKDAYTNKTSYYFDGMKLTWGWIPEVWEATVIDDDMFVRMGPRKYQYRSIDNPHKVSLSYHGIIYSAMNADPISLMDRMIPFDKLFIITAHKLKQLIAKDRGQVFHFDLSMVNPKIGLEKTIYYLNELDIDFYDPLQNASQPGAYQRGKITGATSRSNMQHILSYVNLLAALDQQISDIAGITRQREGWIASQEAVGNSQESISRSAVITEAVYFRPHEALWTEVLNSLVQCAQVALADKRMVKQFILDDMSVAAIDLDPIEFANSDFGVYVSDSAKDNEIFRNMQMYAQALIQNDKVTSQELFEIFEATSVQDIKRAIIKGEQRRQKQYMEQLQAQQQAELEKSQREAQLKTVLQDSINQTKILTEQIKANTQIEEQELENEADIEVAKIRAEAQEEVAEKNIKARKNRD